MKSSKHRNGSAFIDVLLATTIAAALIVPTIDLLVTANAAQRRSDLQAQLARVAQERLEQIRIAVADRGAFDRAALGILPTGIRASEVVTPLPGEGCTIDIRITATDSRRDLLSALVTARHTSTGATRIVKPVQLVTEIARPW